MKVSSIILAFLNFMFSHRKIKSDIDPLKVKSILVVRFGGLGDVIASASFLGNIKDTFPASKITYMTQIGYKDIFNNTNLVDRVICSPKIELGSNIFDLLKQIRWLSGLTKYQFDMTFFLHNDFFSLFMALFFPTKYSVGVDVNNRGFDFALTHSIPYYNAFHPNYKFQKLTLFNNLLDAVGCHETIYRLPLLSLSKEEQLIKFDYIKKLNKPILCIIPGGTVGSKLFGIEKYNEIALKFQKYHGGSVVVVAGKIEQIYKKIFLRDNVYFTSPPLSLRKVFALIKACSLVIGNDTGLMHAAVALEKPTITLFGSTSSEIFGYRGEKHVTIQGDCPYSPCFADECRFTQSCIDRISVEKIYSLLENLLENE